MDVRRVFAENLRTLCGDGANYSAICREMDMNRQQFARYLSGESLPSRANLEKICKYFHVQESALFTIEASPTVNNQSSKSRGVVGCIMDMLAHETPTTMREGVYWVDFASPQFPRSVVRSVMAVKHEETCTTFQRLTGRAERTGSWWSRFRGKHVGVVLHRRGTYYFNAINTIEPREPSMMTMRPTADADLVLVGTANVIGIDTGPGMMVAAISQAPKGMSLLKAIRRARSYDIDAPDIPTHIIDLLNEEAIRFATEQATAIGGIAVN